mmetsp:Transcript_25229/g.30746  ORF Transcript_25229/g.30746 Transcript_25229/m.30746 type:complete len:103 (+) Transcript_25229:480-788(+)
MGVRYPKPEAFYDENAKCVECNIHLGKGKHKRGPFRGRISIKSGIPRYCCVCGNRYCPDCIKKQMLRRNNGGYKCIQCIGQPHRYQPDNPSWNKIIFKSNKE